MAVLLEVEAVLTDRGRGQHERPEGRPERPHAQRDRPESRAGSTRAAGTDFLQRCAREAACATVAMLCPAADRRLREAANPRQRALHLSAQPRATRISQVCRHGLSPALRRTCRPWKLQPALATPAHRCARRRRPATDRSHKPTRPSVTQTPTPLLPPGDTCRKHVVANSIVNCATSNRANAVVRPSSLPVLVIYDRSGVVVADCCLVSVAVVERPHTPPVMRD